MPVIIRGSGGKEPELQSITVPPMSDTQKLTPDEGYDGFSQVIVLAKSTYFGNTSDSWNHDHDASYIRVYTNDDKIPYYICFVNTSSNISLRPTVSGKKIAIIDFTINDEWIYYNGFDTDGNYVADFNYLDSIGISLGMDGNYLTISISDESEYQFAVFPQWRYLTESLNA